MSLGFSTNIVDGATPALRAMLDTFSPGRLQSIAGTAATQRIQMHLRDLDSLGNALGGASTHYYNNQARATHWEPAPGGVKIGIGQENMGMALHYFGGDLGPENLHNAKNFAIPARAEAHGMVPGDFEGQLEVLWGKNGPYALALHLPQMQMRKDGKGLLKDPRPGEGYGEVLFWLTKHVHFDPHPEVLPTEEDLAMAIVGAIYAAWQRDMRNQNPAGGVN